MTPDTELLIIGAGPAGMASAIFAGSEGIQTTLVDAQSMCGGQAGTSALIENYLGFPKGITGDRLIASGGAQLSKFGVNLRCGSEVLSLHQQEVGGWKAQLSGDFSIRATAVVIATGVAWRRLSIDYDHSLDDRLVFHGSRPHDAGLLHGASVAIIGGGNSAGQLAWKLARGRAHVTMIVREDLSKTMSTYLIDKLAKSNRVEIWPHTEVRSLHQSANNRLWVHSEGPTVLVSSAIFDRLYVCIGGEPHTSWVPGQKDSAGYIVTDESFRVLTHSESPLPGLFCIGDCRSHSLKRMTVAAGEGSQVIPFIHSYLQSVP